MQTTRFFHLALVAAVLVGCGEDGPKIADVRGTVTLDGEPVPNASVAFRPLDIKDVNGSVGTTDEKGEYRLIYSTTRIGAVTGRHAVSISALAEDGEGELIPMKYSSEEGDLTTTVESGGNVIDFALSSED